jgi:hypothetical protein
VNVLCARIVAISDLAEDGLVVRWSDVVTQVIKGFKGEVRSAPDWIVADMVDLDVCSSQLCSELVFIKVHRRSPTHIE